MEFIYIGLILILFGGSAAVLSAVTGMVEKEETR